jgi:hypothetical protein
MVPHSSWPSRCPEALQNPLPPSKFLWLLGNGSVNVLTQTSNPLAAGSSHYSSAAVLRRFFSALALPQRFVLIIFFHGEILLWKVRGCSNNEVEQREEEHKINVFLLDCCCHHNLTMAWLTLDFQHAAVQEKAIIN